MIKLTALIFGVSTDLLAFYLSNGFDFPNDTYLFLDDDLYESAKTSAEYIKEREKKKNSYKWDFIINQISHNHFQRNGYNTDTLNSMIIACKLMAQETRHERVKLVNNLEHVINSNVRARIFYSPSFNHIIYVFLSSKFNNSNERRKELEIRCLVAAFLYNKSAAVIGIAWEKQNDLDTYDVVYHNYQEVWTNQFDRNALNAINDLGYFKNHYNELQNTES